MAIDVTRGAEMQRHNVLSARIEALETEAKRYRSEFAALFRDVQELNPGLDAGTHCWRPNEVGGLKEG